VKKRATRRQWNSTLPARKQKISQAQGKRAGIRRKKKRTASEERAKFEREFGSKERVAFVAAMNCVACGFGRPCENHHIQNGGMGKKAHHTKIIPLCVVCHREWHSQGRVAMEDYYGFNADVAAVQAEQDWREYVKISVV
jgi:hypothetical protein